MATNQENIIATIEAEILETGLNYNQAIMKLAEYHGFSGNDFSSLFIQYLQMATDTSETNLPSLIAKYAELNFDGNVNSINDFTILTAGGNYDFQDGTNYLFQDGTNYQFN